MSLVYSTEYHKEDLYEYLADDFDVAAMTDEHWMIVGRVLSKWQIVDEDTLWDLPNWLEGENFPLAK